MQIDLEVLRSKMLGTLAGFGEHDAGRIVDVLLWADMAGIPTQGVIKLTGTEPLQNVEPTGPITVERETSVSMSMDAGANPAPLVAQVATDHAIAKATAHGISIVAMHNVFSSTGAQAYYANRMAERGLIGIVQSRAGATTAGFGRIDPLFGTNPMAFSFPTTGTPISFDMTTSAMTWYGLVLASARGIEIPEGMAIDETGAPTTDPNAAMNGALMPFTPDHKGAGLALTVELLAGVLSGAEYGEVEGEWGSTFIAIDPEVTIGRQEFARRSTHLAEKIRGSRPGAGQQDVRLPGERAAAAHARAQATGVVEVDKAILRKLGYL